MKAHVLATKINSILTDNKFDRFVGGKTRGKLDFTSLARISFSDRVFKKREARLNKDYKLIVLADASGSMRGSPAAKTVEALTMLNSALSNTDVEYAIWSFNQDILCLKDFKESSGKNLEGLYEKHRHERTLYTCQRCGTCFGAFYGVPVTNCISCNVPFRSDNDFMTESASGGNADGLALHLAFEEINKLPGKHIIVVLSDGQADCINETTRSGISARYMAQNGVLYRDMNLSKVVQKVVDSGIVLCSIGIMCNDVLKHYPKENTIVVSSSDGIPEALIKLISKQIKRG